MFDFIDTETVVWCMITITVILAIIITFFPTKQKLTFEEWFWEVEKIFLKNGFASSYTSGLNKRLWEDMYNEGFKPREAVDEYLHI
jgi:hypothetical protein